jgi:hypothetical protein
VDDDPKQQPLLKEENDESASSDEDIDDYQPVQISRPHPGNRDNYPMRGTIGSKSITAMLADQPPLSSFGGGIPEDITSESKKDRIGGLSITAMLGKQESWMQDDDTEDLLEEINAEVRAKGEEEKRKSHLF